MKYAAVFRHTLFPPTPPQQEEIDPSENTTLEIPVPELSH